MTPEQWRRIDQIFQQAADLPLEERDAFLAAVCGPDQELRGEVESLLAAAGDHLVGPAVAEALSQFAAPSASVSLAGQTVGDYQVLECIGQGGMGAVYRAQRTGPGFSQQVALKVLRGDLVHGELTARFLAERRILSTLDHPFIARLIDGGSHQGLPYLVMEYASGGVPIDEYCRQQRLDTRARLELFRKVCQAVQHAHQRLVVHRDLKPSNILVLPSGDPKLLDFGIAKLLEEDPAHATPGTQTGWRLLTPEYASPEQVRGEPVSVASDVYSLGVVLYELLAGQRPYRFQNYSPGELESLVCRIPPPPPSSLASGDTRLRRTLAGDLDNILLMALRKEPERRYQTVEQFADDLRRHLEGHTVIARPDTVTYRFRKFVRRNRLSVALGTALAISVAVGTAFTLREGWRAQQRFTQVRAFAHSVLTDFDAEARKLPGSTRLRQVMVDQSLRYLDSLAAEAASDADLQQELAVAYHRIADIQGYPAMPNLGQREMALDSHRKALAIEESLLARKGPSEALVRSLAMGYGRASEIERWRGNRAEADVLLEKALRFAGQGDAQAFGNVRLQEARRLSQREEFHAALRVLDEALAVARGMADPALAIVICHEIAQVYLWLGQPHESIAHVDAGLSIVEAARPQWGRDAGFLRRESALLALKSDALAMPTMPSLERPCDALPLNRRAMEIYEPEAQFNATRPSPRMVGMSILAIWYLADCGGGDVESLRNRAIRAMGGFSEGQEVLQLAMAYYAWKQEGVSKAQRLLAPLIAEGEETPASLELAAGMAPSAEAIPLLRRARELRVPKLETAGALVNNRRYEQIRNLERAIALGDRDPALPGELRALLAKFPEGPLAPRLERLRSGLPVAANTPSRRP